MALDKDRLRQAVEEQRRRGATGASPLFVDRPSKPAATESAGPRAPQESSNTSAWKFLGIAGVVVLILWNFSASNNQRPAASQQIPTISPPVQVQAPRVQTAPHASPDVKYQGGTNNVIVTPSKVSEEKNKLSNLADLRSAAISANASGIELTLSLATTTSDKEQILQQAVATGRGFDFRSQTIERNRRLARSLHDSALGAFSRWPRESDENCSLLEQAFTNDPLDSEIAGNLAICFVRGGNGEQGKQQALYALSLPKALNGAGRTADWVTLSAAYATLGDQARARAAMFVALAGVDDPVKRCTSARYSIKNTFGPVIKPATIAMFDRIQELRLTTDPACTMPIE